MKEWTITFLDDREPLVIKGETFIAAVEEYIRERQDLRYANLTGANLQGADLTGANLHGADLSFSNLTNATLQGADLSLADLMHTDLGFADLTGANLVYVNLTGANLYCANLQGADLTGTNLRGANLDYSFLPFSCHSLEIKVDKRIACQLLYHTLRAMQSVDDAEVKALLNDDKALALANQFHRVAECGSIVKEQSNE
jgi:hypothetical protein